MTGNVGMNRRRDDRGPHGSPLAALLAAASLAAALAVLPATAFGAAGGAPSIAGSPFDLSAHDSGTSRPEVRGNRPR